MKKLTFFALFFISGVLIAGHGWERVNYMQSTIFSTQITVNNKPLSNTDMLGAFVGNECRMIAPIFIVDNKSYVSSVIHGDVPETVEFRIWIQQKDTVIVVPQKITTIPGENLLDYSINVVMK